MSNPELLLSNQICFLVYRLDRAIMARYRPLLSELGLTYPQYLAMLVFWEHGELLVGRLCELLHLDTGTVSPLLKRLEKAGLVERRRSRKDERQVVVSITEKGRDLENQARAVPGALASCIIGTEEEYTSLKGLFAGLVDRLEGDECSPLPGT